MHGAEDMMEEMPQHGMAKDSKTPMTEEGQPEGTGQTIEVPIEFAEGRKFKVGDEMIVKVVGMEDGKFQLKYAHGPEGEKEGEAEGKSEPPSADDEIDQMAANDSGY